jgi:hypothetical protein
MNLVCGGKTDLGGGKSMDGTGSEASRGSKRNVWWPGARCMPLR